jgi:hypothetical protein
MFIDADLRAMIVARFELVGTEETPGVPDTPAGLAAARSSALRELVRLIYDIDGTAPMAGRTAAVGLIAAEVGTAEVGTAQSAAVGSTAARRAAGVGTASPVAAGWWSCSQRDPSWD